MSLPCSQFILFGVGSSPRLLPLPVVRNRRLRFLVPLHIHHRVLNEAHPFDVETDGVGEFSGWSGIGGVESVVVTSLGEGSGIPCILARAFGTCDVWIVKASHAMTLGSR